MAYVDAAHNHAVNLIEQGSKPAAPAAGAWKAYVKSDGFYIEDSSATEYGPFGSGAGDVLYSQLLAMQITNEIKGWPPIVNTGDLEALGLWFDKAGTPSTAPSVVAVSGEAGITENYELALKVVADEASEGLSQRFTFADEPRVKSGRRLSTLWAIWCVGGVGATLSIINSSAEETAAAKVTAAGWSIVEVPNHLLAGTYCDIKIVTDGAGTIYAVPLGANIGARGLPLKPRGLRRVDICTASVVNAADPGGTAWTDADFTASSSPLAAFLFLHVTYSNQTTANQIAKLRRNGDTTTTGLAICRNQAASATPNDGETLIACDDGQVVEYGTGAAALDTEAFSINIRGWLEWE